MKVRPGVEVAGLTDIGCNRQNNEDNYAYWEPGDDAAFQRLGRLAIVADGMGGAEGGQYASRMAGYAVRNTYAASRDGDPQHRPLLAFQGTRSPIQQEAR